MAEQYGIKARLLTGDAKTPATSASCYVVFGNVLGRDAHVGEPKKLYTYEEYLTAYYNDPTITLVDELSLDKAARYILSNISGVWFVNINVNAETTEDMSNLDDYVESALSTICMQTSDIPNIICAPGDIDATSLNTLVKCCKGGVNDLYHAQAFVDCAQSSDQIENGDPVASRITVSNMDGCLISCWGNVVIDEDPDGTIKDHIPASIVISCQRALQDNANINHVPYRSVGNLRVSMKGLCIIDNSGASPVYTKCTCKQNKMNEVVENGIVSFVNKGNNRWYTWGDHTSAVTAGTVDDETYRFDSNVAVLYHILNRFIVKWGNIIDSPMTLRLRDCILAEEQDYLNGLKALGCLVGDPKCEFKPIVNSSDTLAKGQFYFSNIATVTPPAKYVELQLQYTDAGLSAYIAD